MLLDGQGHAKLADFGIARMATSTIATENAATGTAPCELANVVVSCLEMAFAAGLTQNLYL